MKMVLAAWVAVFLISSIQLDSASAQEDPRVIKLKALCDEGNGTACFKLGERYRTLELDNKTAKEYHLKACDGGYITGCTHAGILIQMDGQQYSKQWKKAAKLFQKGCDVKSDKACFNLGRLKYKEGRAKSAKKYWKIACDLGNMVACQNLKKLNR